PLSRVCPMNPRMAMDCFASWMMSTEPRSMPVATQNRITRSCALSFVVGFSMVYSRHQLLANVATRPRALANKDKREYGHRCDQQEVNMTAQTSAVSGAGTSSWFVIALFLSQALRECRHGRLASRLVAVSQYPVPAVPIGQRPEPGRSFRCGCRLHDATDYDAVDRYVGIVPAPFTGGTARRRPPEDQRGRRSHRCALGRSSTCLPASVIRTRVTCIARSPAITRSVVTLASPALISSTNRSLLKPCASRIAAVQPSGDAASNSSARQRSALRRGSSAISAMHWM